MKLSICVSLVFTCALLFAQTARSQTANAEVTLNQQQNIIKKVSKPPVVKPPTTLPKPAHQSQKQQQQQGQAQSQVSTGGEASGGAVSNSEVYKEIRQAPMAYAPESIPSAPCRTAGSAGVSAPIGGLSLGGSKMDKECDKRETARAFALVGRNDLALQILCNTRAAKDAGIKDCGAIILNRIVIDAPVESTPPSEPEAPAPNLNVNVVNFVPPVIWMVNPVLPRLAHKKVYPQHKKVYAHQSFEVLPGDCPHIAIDCKDTVATPR